MKSHDLLLEQLTEEEQKEFEILADRLIPRGWEEQLSSGKFAKLLQDYSDFHIDKNHADRKLKKFQEIGLIEIQKNSTATNGTQGRRLANTIKLKSFAYKGPLLTGEVPLDSILYIDRDADEKCRRELTLEKEVKESVPFIRVKAAKGMGKSSLLSRIGHYLEREKKEIVARVDLGTDAFGSDAFTDLEKLFYRFTEEVAAAFIKSIPGLEPPELQFAWNKYKPAGKNCTDYLEEHIFKRIAKKPKTLLIDGIDCILGKPTQTDFLLVLRTWNETKMKRVDRAEIIWPSVVIAYSTEPYPDANFKGSPLQNVGTPVELSEFTPESILNLAKIYGLNWDLSEVNRLMKLIGGHPSLVQRALYQVSQTDINLEELEEKATEITGPFSDYLLKDLELLQAPKNEQLRVCFLKIIQGERSNDAFAKFQLEKIGLIRVNGKEEAVSCELYKRFFEEYLG
ncbi:MAG: hypothetical protein F6K35_10950 [Okeania sp. SIO2H7]|nr:hypothetical protein [Okeania sp. SIO2H7]